MKPRAERFAAVAAGMAADRLLGEPPRLVHPVAAFGSGMSRVEHATYADRRSAGVLHAGLGLSVGLASGWLLGRLIGRRGLPALAAATYVAVASRSLRDAAAGVERPLRRGDFGAARAALPALVGRDPSHLDAGEMARAVVESVAENTVDAVVAPALWAAGGGAPGAFAYRALNTLDAMVGHRTPRYDRFGWASARADDVAAWVPARAAAALVAVVRPRSTPAIWRAVRDQAPGHPSPNAGVAEAAFAAALGLTLGGTNVYAGRVETRPALGTGRPAGVHDIDRACDLSRDVTAALGLMLCLPWLAQQARRRSR